MSDEIVVAYEGGRRFDGVGEGGGEKETSLLTPSLSILSPQFLIVLHLKKLLPYYLLLITLLINLILPIFADTYSHLIQHRRLTTGKWKLERRQA